MAAELAFRVAKSGSTRSRQALDMFLAPLQILPFDTAAVGAYGDLLVDLELRGTPIGSLDTMIADHALSLRATLVTNNTHDFAKVSVQGKRDGMVNIRLYLQQNLLPNK